MKCNESYTEDNIIPILPPQDADKQRLITRGQKLAEQGLTHSLKKAPGSKKRKKHANGDESRSAPGAGKTTTSRSGTSTPTTNTGIKNAATAMLTARVLEEENERKKRKKMMGANENLESLFTKESKDGKKGGGDFMTRGFTIPAGAKR